MSEPVGDGADGARRHLAAVRAGLSWLEAHLDVLAAWAGELAERLGAGGRLLVAGNGGSAALAQHLTAELVGRYLGERPPFSAIALSADVATLTALGNDYGFTEAFARQVAAHGRPADVFLGLSTSGRSPNLVRAAETARRSGLRTWALTGPGPNPLTEASHTALAVEGSSTATVQELHQVAVHLLCAGFDERIAGFDERILAAEGARPAVGSVGVRSDGSGHGVDGLDLRAGVRSTSRLPAR